MKESLARGGICMKWFSEFLAENKSNRFKNGLKRPFHAYTATCQRLFHKLFALQNQPWGINLVDIIFPSYIRTVLHIACLLGDDGIIRVLLRNGANVDVKDTEGNTPAHLAAKWCSREENYCNFKLVMTPLIRACPGILEIENNNGETPQKFLDKGAKRSAELHEEERLKFEKIKQEEDAKEAKLDSIDEKRYGYTSVFQKITLSTKIG